MTRLRRIPIIALGLILSLAPLPALSQGTDMAAAEALFQEGRELMKAGRFTEACPKLAESQRLDPAVGTLLYLAECYERNGQTASAWATFELAAAEGRKDNQAEREKLARERAERLVGRLSRLTILVPPTASVQGLVVTRNDMEIRAASWGVALPVDPGQHVVRAAAPGKNPWATEVLVGPDGAATQVEIPPLQDAAPAIAPAPPPAPPMLPPPAPAPAPEPSAPKDTGTNASQGRTQRILGLAVGGAGVVGMGVGAALMAAAQKKEKDSEKYCTAPSYTRCTQKGVDLIDQAKGQNTMGTVLLGVGGAMVAGGVVLFLTAPKGEKQASQSAGPQVAVVPTISFTGGATLAVRADF